MPADGTRKFYAGVYGQGLFFADRPTGPWTNLCGVAPGLPTPASLGAHFVVLVDHSPRNPGRVYAMVARLQQDHEGVTSVQVFVSRDWGPASVWEPRGAGPPHGLDNNLEGHALLVAPEPEGSDANDVLVCSAAIMLSRSTDGGRNWVDANPSRIHHVDTRSLAHHPPKTAYYPDALPPGASAPRARIYIGDDGGIGASRGYTDPAFAFDTRPADWTFNAGAVHDSTLGLVESLNFGLATAPAHRLACTPDLLAGGPMSALCYLTALDGDGARRVGSTAWSASYVTGGDSGHVYVTTAPDGVRGWVNKSVSLATNVATLWPAWLLLTFVDRDVGPSSSEYVATPRSSTCGPTSNAVAAPDGGCFIGVIALEQVTELMVPADPGTNVEIVPRVMTPDIVVGARAYIGDDPGTSVLQSITSTAVDRFTVTFYGGPTRPQGTPVRIVRSYVARVSGSMASRISQTFIPQTHRLYRLARAADTLLAASADQRLWHLDSASIADENTVWTEVQGRPIDLGTTIDPDDDVRRGEFVSGLELHGSTAVISDLASDVSETFYVLLSQPVSGVVNGTAVETPLFRIQDGAWVAEPCSLPVEASLESGDALGRLVAHPSQVGRLFAARHARVYELRRDVNEWTWTELTGDLPGQEIHDLWIGNIAAAGASPRIVLRAATALRGVWELELDRDDTGGPHLYFRDHRFDPGWLGSSADGVVSPLDPNRQYWHWQSPDIKVDTPLRDNSGALYYQNDPEAPTPTADDFAWIKNRSEAAAAGTTARVWVRVNNRSIQPSGPANVWAISCRFSAGLPALPTDFWTRFRRDGTIDASNLAGPWTSLGLRSVSDIHAESPGVADFAMQTGSAGDHRCIVAFVHGPNALLDTSGLTLFVDDATPRNRQIAQRNVIVVDASSDAAGSQTSELLGTDTDAPGDRDLRVYIEFHNPQNADATSITINLRALPSTCTLEARLSRAANPRRIDGARLFGMRDGILRWMRMRLTQLVDPILSRFRAATTSTSSGVLPLSSAVYLATGGTTVELQDCQIPPQGRVAMELTVRLCPELEPGAHYQIDILQLIKSDVIGGASVVIRVAGGQAVPPLTIADWGIERETSDTLEMQRRRNK
jgi:hypothetical protein